MTKAHWLGLIAVIFIAYYVGAIYPGIANSIKARVS